MAVILPRDDLTQDGVAMLRYIENRSKANTEAQVKAVYADIAKEKLAFSGTYADHEATVVRIDTLHKLIHPDSAGGPTKVQSLILAAMPVECKVQMNQIKLQLEMARQIKGDYQNTYMLLNAISPIIREQYVERAETHVTETFDKRARSARWANTSSRARAAWART